MKNVAKVNHKFVRIRQNIEDCPEKSLWRAIICQAIEDALITSNNSRRKCFKRRALKWLAEESEDLDFVCEMAGVKKKAMLEYLKKII